MFVLIEGGEVLDPQPRGKQSVLVAGDRIAKMGDVDRNALDRLGVDCDVVDATNCFVVPGLIDPHAHLLGSSGEGSLALQTPMVFVEEIASSGVTTLVATLGVDTTMKTVAGLLARVKTMNELGLSCRMWSGGYNVPPTTMLGSVRQDMMYVDEVIGAGEIAISDERGLNQSAQELAKLVRDTHVGGLLTGKAGLTHFHVGDEKTRLKPLRDIVEDFQVKCEWLYPTHIHRSAELLDEAIDLANAGAYVDMDVVNEDVAKWLRYYIDNGGPIEKLTMSSDMDSSTPEIFYRQFCELVVKHRYSLDLVLPLFTSNTAAAVKLEKKGKLCEGNDADVLVVTKRTLDIMHVISRGKPIFKDGRPRVREKWLEKSKRKFALVGDDHPSQRDA
jgi:beta-aspartyl-dipeptidase (metallo-type)